MATSPYDLTTVQNLTMFSQGQIGQDAQSQALAQMVLTAVSYKIQRLMGRIFKQNNYIEFQNSFQRQTRSFVKNWPLTAIKSLRWGFANTVYITYSGSAPSASITVTTPDSVTFERSVILRTVDVAGAVEVPLDISTEDINPSAIQTTQGLVDAINALNSDWTANLYANYNVPTRYLFPMFVPMKTGANVYQGYLSYPYVDLFNYQFASDGSFSYSLLSSFDYFFDSMSAATYQLQFPGLFQGVMVEYEAGYSQIPPDVAQLAMELSLMEYLKGQINPYLKSENLDQYAYTYGDIIALDSKYINDRLYPYKKIALSGCLG